MRITRRYTQAIHAPPASVFPLLCPVREREWLDGWSCTVVHSESGVAEAGCIFTTEEPGAATTVWTVTRYRPPSRIAFFRVTPGETAVDITIGVSRGAVPGTSTVDIAYTYTALGDAGVEAILALDDEAWHEMIRFWEASMNHYLETGARLPAEHPA